MHIHAIIVAEIVLHSTYIYTYFNYIFFNIHYFKPNAAYIVLSLSEYSFVLMLVWKHAKLIAHKIRKHVMK